MKGVLAAWGSTTIPAVVALRCRLAQTGPIQQYHVLCLLLQLSSGILTPPYHPHPPFSAVTLMSPFSTLRGSALPSFLPIYMGLLFKKHLPTRPSFLLLFLRFCGLYRLICPATAPFPASLGLSGSSELLCASIAILSQCRCFCCFFS